MRRFDLFKVSTTAPQSGNVLWVDVSSGMPIIRAFNGGVWEATSPGSAALAQIDALIASLAIMNSQLTGLTPLAAPVTYAELVNLISNNELVPNSSYRITDYTTTTVQANTQSAGHNFDVIVTALSTNELSENAKCVRKSDDTYFANAKLEAWEIKYCINNDTSRFAWADAVNGKGVIYYMKDEWGNECSYDFKNIQFVRYPILTMPDGSTNLVYDVDNQKIKYGLKDQSDTIFPNGATIDEVNPSFYYTFNAIASSDELDNNIYDASIIQVGITTGEDSDFIVQNNIIKELYTSINSSEDIYGQVSKLNNICISNVIYNLTFTELSSGCYSNTFGNTCGSNTFGNNCFLNTFGNGCSYNTFGNSCYYNTFSIGCYLNTFGNGCVVNTFGDGFGSNTLGNDCFLNTFGNNCTDNTFGNGCGSNTFGNNGGSNTFGNTCQYNTFDNNCSQNTFGNNCNCNTFYDYCSSNTFGNDCSFNTFGNNCTDNTFGNDCTDNTFGDVCGSNTFGNDCFLNTFGKACDNNNFYVGTSGTTKKDYIRYLVLEDGCRYNNFYSTLTTSPFSFLQRIRIKGLENTAQTDTQITLAETGTNYEWLICYTSTGELKQYCPND